MLTGEPVPVEKAAGARVTGGTVNGTGAFVMRAERVGADTMLARIVQMVSEAQRSRAPIQRLADQVSAWFVPAVMGVAIADVRYLGIGWTTAAPGLCAGERGCGPDHRLSVRAGAGHADVHHGRDRARRVGRRADPQCRGARNARESGHAGRRQDRDADRGKAEAGFAPPMTKSCDWQPALKSSASIRWLRPLWRAPLERNLVLTKAENFRSETWARRQGRRRRSPSLRRTGRTTWWRARSGQTVVAVTIDDQPAGTLALADPIKVSAREAIDQSASRRSSHRHAHRRQPLRRGSGGACARASMKYTPMCCRRKSGRDRAICRRKAASLRWPATASTTLRLWRARTWESRWVREPTSPSRARPLHW